MERTELTQIQKKRLGVLALVIAVALLGAASYFVGRPLVRFAKEPERFRACWSERF